MALNIALATLIAKSLIVEKYQTDSVITIGKLDLAISPKVIKSFGLKYNVTLSQDSSAEGADFLLKKILNSDSIDSIDVSNYQGCSIVHDLNFDLDKKYHNKYDVLIDGGSLEHVFNVPVALNNYKNLVKENGNLFISTMANNHMGHGFYQFSPELFFRYFCEQNGFELKSVVLVEHSFPTTQFGTRLKYFSVSNPSNLNKRVGLVSKRPVIILVHAVKRESRILNRLFLPIQHDYQLLHTMHYSKSEGRRGLIAFLKALLNKLPTSLAHLVFGFHELQSYSFKNKIFYKRWED